MYGDILTKGECKKAANTLEISKWKGEKLNRHRARLPYCWVGKGGGANFNVNGDEGRKIDGSSLICKRGNLQIF